MLFACCTLTYLACLAVRPFLRYLFFLGGGVHSVGFFGCRHLALSVCFILAVAFFVLSFSFLLLLLLLFFFFFLFLSVCVYHVLLVLWISFLHSSPETDISHPFSTPPPPPPTHTLLHVYSNLSVQYCIILLQNHVLPPTPPPPPPHPLILVCFTDVSQMCVHVCLNVTSVA